MKYRVFIDGAEGTTGLKIHEYFSRRDDIEVIPIAEEKRKDMEERLSCIRQADVSFLCLPDAASLQIAAAAPKECAIIDTSTAHRTDDEWVYGMPELSEDQRRLIGSSTRIANPGCHATGAILLINPLVRSGLVPADYPFSAYSLTGYSGGGKKMIAQYEGGKDGLASPRQYGITQKHKHLPEIVKYTGITGGLSFMPVVADYFSGMQVTVPVSGSHVRGNSPREDVCRVFREYYDGCRLVNVRDHIDEGGFIASDRLSGSNRLEIAVEGNDESILLVATFDNLGKGASGAAVQNMNILLGIDETKGLI